MPDDPENLAEGHQLPTASMSSAPTAAQPEGFKDVWAAVPGSEDKSVGTFDSVMQADTDSSPVIDSLASEGGLNSLEDSSLEHALEYEAQDEMTIAAFPTEVASLDSASSIPEEILAN